jgi:hypothetical protein
MTGSVMHYGKDAFAKDKTKPTIIPIPNENVNLGSNVNFTWVRTLMEAIKKKKNSINLLCSWIFSD